MQEITSLLPAVRALKIFYLFIRPTKLARKYFKPFVGFIRENTQDTDKYSDEELINYVFKKVWVDRDEKEYTENISKIEPDYMISVKNTAYLLARGSGRVPIAQLVIDKIEEDFS